MKTQTRAILASVVVIALALSAVSGVTYSWWSASENTEIEITTGYLDVDTSNFTMYDVTDEKNKILITEADDAPENIDLAYEISKDNPIGADSVLAPNGVDEVYEIKYTANFDANVYSKYMVGCTCTSDANGWVKVVTTTSSGAANQWQYFLGDENAQTNPNGNGRQTSVDVTITITLDDETMPQNVSERITITNQILQVAMPYNLLIQDMINDGLDVKLYSDLKMDETLKFGTSYEGVLDLNGHDITKNGVGEAILNYGSLTIVGDGNVTTTDDSSRRSADVINNHGTLVIEGGTYDSSSGNALNNFGTATVNGGTFLGEGYKKNNEGIDIYAYSISNRDGTMVINDATVPAGDNHGALASNKGTLTVNGGNYALTDGAFYALYVSDGDIVVNGGTYTKNGASKTSDLFCIYGNGHISVNGGTFIGGTGVDANPENYLSDGREVYNKSGTNEYFVVNFDGITSAQELLAISAMISSTESLSGKTIRLAADIDMEGVEWTPIGGELIDSYINSESQTVNVYSAFSGTFDGNGHVISNLTYGDSANPRNNAGLFGYVKGATITGFDLVDAKIVGVEGVGAAIGSAGTDVIISDIDVVRSEIVGNHWVGGIVGYTYSGIDSCSVTGSKISATPNEFDAGVYDNGDKVGGIAGWASNGAVIRCSVSDCTISAYRDVGGILGYANGENNVMQVVGNQVNDTVVTIDRDVNAGNDAMNVREIVGRIGTGKGVTQSGNVFNNVSTVCVVSDNDELTAALGACVTKIVLEKGDYLADLYSVSSREKLTITGEGADTNLEFANLQVRASQFKELTIDNCTIKRMPNKSWGHLVFGSSNIPGIYTVSNCIFNGVGSQGIYINQNVEATFNIENCEFNGDFGGEGAITIQNNDGVGITVNVADCEFNNVPTTSHEICVNYAYNGWTLNAEGVSVYWKANASA